MVKSFNYEFSHTSKDIWAVIGDGPLMQQMHQKHVQTARGMWFKQYSVAAAVGVLSQNNVDFVKTNADFASKSPCGSKTLYEIKLRNYVSKESFIVQRVKDDYIKTLQKAAAENAKSVEIIEALFGSQEDIDHYEEKLQNSLEKVLVAESVENADIAALLPINRKIKVINI